MKRNNLLLLFLLMMHTVTAGAAQRFQQDTNRLIRITVLDKQAMINDTITCQYWDHYLDLGSQNNIPVHILTSLATNAVFIFSQLEKNKGAYFILKRGAKKILNIYLAEAGDDVTIEINGENILFSGKGAAKYQCRYEAGQAIKVWSSNPAHAVQNIKLPEGIRKQFAYPAYISKATGYFEEKMDTIMHVLRSFQDKMSKWSYEITMADLYGRMEMDKLNGFIYYYYNMEIPIPIEQKDSLKQEMLDRYRESKLNLAFADSVQLFSAGYTSFLTTQAYRAEILYHQKGIDWIIQNYRAEQKDKLLTAFLLQTTHDTPNDVLQQTVLLVKTFPWKEIVLQLTNRQGKGVPAYPFELTDSSGRMVRLEDFKGKAVMLEFWFTGCSGCAAIAHQMPRITQAFAGNNNIVFASVSIDTDIDTWKTSLQSKKYTGPGYINMYTGGKGIDHPLIKYYQLQACPKTLIIDKNGNIFSNLEPDFASQASVDAYINLLQKAAQ